MTEPRKPRGGWSNSASAKNGAKSADSPSNGRPPQTATIRLGQRVAVLERNPVGLLPLVAGTVTEIKRGVPRVVVVTMEDGTEYRLMI